MCSDCLGFEFTGRLRYENTWRDNSFYFHALKVKNELSYHSGCVNTICWNESGEYLLSGSDDRKIAVSKSFSNDFTCENLFIQKLPAFSNIFTAKFIPYSCGSEVIAGFKCGCVLYVHLNSPSTENVKLTYCHKFAVYDILTFSELSSCFLTISHDQSVMFFDTRLSNNSKLPHYCSRNCFGSQSSPVNSFPVVNQLRFNFPVTAGDVHPLDGSHCIALATADGFVRLFDLRKLVSTYDSGTPTGNVVQPHPYKIARPVGLPAKFNSSQVFRLDYGPCHITSVKFEPFYQPECTHFLPSFGHRKPIHSRSDYGGKRILVSHMYAPVFLYDLTSDEAVRDSVLQPPDWLPTPDSTVSTTSSNVDNTNNNPTVEESLISDPNIRLTVALYRWFIRHRAQAGSNSEDESNTETQSNQSDTSSESTPEQQQHTTRSPPLDLLTEEYVSNVLASIPRCRQLMAYRGRRCCSTVIKASTFWGRNYILSGSECGHLIAWDRTSGRPVHAIKADNAVVNRIAPHPHFPILACSGIDCSIKIIEPDPNVYQSDDDTDDERRHVDDDGDDNDHPKSVADCITNVSCSRTDDKDIRCKYVSVVKKHEEEAHQLCDKNELRTKETLNLGTAYLDRIARLRTGQVARMILLRITQAGNHSESSDSTN